MFENNAFPSVKVLFINDNHCRVRGDSVVFEGSTFHTFLKGFNLVAPILSSPCVDLGPFRPGDEQVVNGVRVWLRRGYGTAKQFYIHLPLMVTRGVLDLWQQIQQVDAVVMTLPASLGPVTYACARLQRKPVIVYVVGDVQEVISEGGAYKGLMGEFAKLAAAFEAAFTRYAARRNTTFVLGQRMLGKLERAGSKPHPAMTSLVRESLVQQPRHQVTFRSIRLVTVGRLSAEKGYPVALLAIRALLDEGRDVSYTIIGSGPIEGQLRLQIRELGLDNRVQLLGRMAIEQIFEEIFPKSDVFVLPSQSEGIPKVLLEAMAGGLSVVASNVGGVPDIVGLNGERGWLVEPGDPKALQDALGACIDNTAERGQRIEAASRFIREHTMEAETGRIQQVILDEFFGDIGNHK